jgi:hypothetical protein
MSRKMFWRYGVFFSSLIVLVVTSVTLMARVSTAGATTVGNDVSVINWHSASHGSQHVATTAQAIITTGSQPKIKSIPYWTSSFTYQKRAYPYTMVGTDPAKGSAVTTVPTLLVPITVILSNGATYNGQKKVNDLLNSPLFRPASFNSGSTQYGDAIQRAEFWKYVSAKSPSYHVLLARPTVLPTLTLHVPAGLGAQIKRPSGVVFGGIDVTYLDGQLVKYMQVHHIAPQTFPIFLSSNVLATETNGTICCIGGYHNAVSNANNTAIQTYAYATYNDPGFSLTNKKVFTTTDALSHEISEWYNDPFTNNIVPNWSVASAPQYGCNNSLEVGDPLVGVGFDVGKYHLQDEASFSWFAHQVPSISINKHYSYLGTFTTVAKIC